MRLEASTVSEAAHRTHPGSFVLCESKAAATNIFCSESKAAATNIFCSESKAAATSAQSERESPLHYGDELYLWIIKN